MARKGKSKAYLKKLRRKHHLGEFKKKKRWGDLSVDNSKWYEYIE